MKIQKILLTAGAAALFATAAQGAVLVNYNEWVASTANPSNSTLKNNTTSEYVTASALVAGNPTHDSPVDRHMREHPTSGTFLNALFLRDSYVGDDTSVSFSSTAYLEFTLSSLTSDLSLGTLSFDLGVRMDNGKTYTSNIGLWVNIDGEGWQQVALSFTNGMSSKYTDLSWSVTDNTAIDAAALALSVTSGSSNIGGTQGDSPYIGYVTADLSDFVAQDSIAFHIGFTDGGSQKGIAIQNLQVTATPIPEPSTYALGAAGLLAGLALIRRRRK